jgi:hypothetical protein
MSGRSDKARNSSQGKPAPASEGGVNIEAESSIVIFNIAGDMVGRDKISQMFTTNGQPYASGAADWAAAASRSREQAICLQKTLEAIQSLRASGSLNTEASNAIDDLEQHLRAWLSSQDIRPF